MPARFLICFSSVFFAPHKLSDPGCSWETAATRGRFRAALPLSRPVALQLNGLVKIRGARFNTRLSLFLSIFFSLSLSIVPVHCFNQVAARLFGAGKAGSFPSFSGRCLLNTSPVSPARAALQYSLSYSSFSLFPSLALFLSFLPYHLQSNTHTR